MKSEINTDTQNKHTPLPWKLSNKPLLENRIIPGDGNEGFTVAMVSGFDLGERQANAAFIVQACNAHYELIEACKAVLARLNTRTAHIESCDLPEEDEQAIEQASAAILKAQSV